jgi:hypothetical protein
LKGLKPIFFNNHNCSARLPAVAVGLRVGRQAFRSQELASIGAICQRLEVFKLLYFLFLRQKESTKEKSSQNNGSPLKASAFLPILACPRTKVSPLS